SCRRRHTRFSRDWSSDVCSSDLARSDLFCYDVQDTPDNECADVTTTLKQATAVTPANLVPLTTDASGEFSNDATIKTQMDAYTKIGRASCRKSVRISREYESVNK